MSTSGQVVSLESEKELHLFKLSLVADTPSLFLPISTELAFRVALLFSSLGPGIQNLVLYVQEVPVYRFAEVSMMTEVASLLAKAGLPWTEFHAWCGSAPNDGNTTCGLESSSLGMCRVGSVIVGSNVALPLPNPLIFRVQYYDPSAETRIQVARQAVSYITASVSNTFPTVTALNVWVNGHNRLLLHQVPVTTTISDLIKEITLPYPEFRAWVGSDDDGDAPWADMLQCSSMAGCTLASVMDCSENLIEYPVMRLNVISYEGDD